MSLKFVPVNTGLVAVNIYLEVAKGKTSHVAVETDLAPIVGYAIGSELDDDESWGEPVVLDNNWLRPWSTLGWNDKTENSWNRSLWVARQRDLYKTRADVLFSVEGTIEAHQTSMRKWAREGEGNA